MKMYVLSFRALVLGQSYYEYPQTRQFAIYQNSYRIADSSRSKVPRFSASI